MPAVLYTFAKATGEMDMGQWGRTLMVLGLAGLVTGCVSRPLSVDDGMGFPESIAAPAPSTASGPLSLDLARSGSLREPEVVLRQRLHAQAEAWRAVPYRHGGLSQAGIDCSGLVHVTFRDQFGIDLPRETSWQVQEGESVDRGRWRAGDLVFFRIDRRTRHVGIYLGHGEFLHASSSQGVMVSRLDDRYWAQRYWTARRLPVLDSVLLASRSPE